LEETNQQGELKSLKRVKKMTGKKPMAGLLNIV
jgi:hypothetical protein